MEYKQPLLAPISAGQKVGVVKFTLGGKLSIAHPLVALELPSAGNFWPRLG